MVQRETSYNNLLNLMYSNLKVNIDVYDVKMKTLLSVSRTSKCIHNIHENDNLEVAFDECFNGVTHMFMICATKVEKYTMKV